MNSYLKWTAIAVAAAIHSCTAQTYTDCNPLSETCDPDDGLATWSFSTDFTTGESTFDGWSVTSGSVSSTTLGAEFVINEQGDAPTIASDFYIFFGYLEVTMRAANGTGIISTAILQSDDLDEIDWEQVSTFNDQIQTNYFGKGNTTSYDRSTTVAVSAPSDTFHTYGISWTAEKTEWYIDGTLVRTLNYADALGGSNYPQTPMQIRIGIWAGGDPNNAEGTIQWAGGETDYTQGPFTMYVESVNVINYNPAESYNYTDNTGSYTSISQSNSTSDEGTGDTSSETISSSSISVIHSTTPASSSTGSVPVIPTTTAPASSSGSIHVTPTTTIPSTSGGSIPVITPIIPIPTGTNSNTETTICVTGTAAGGWTQSASASQTTLVNSSPTAFFNGSPAVLSSNLESLWAIFATCVAAVLQF
ncbi:concanavalin A-like lectin/glucanase domain-containing protein [Aspergillus spectabilis]